MAQGKRITLVSQASLVWALANDGTSSADIERFVIAGSLHNGNVSAYRRNAMPMDENVLKHIQETGGYGIAGRH